MKKKPQKENMKLLVPILKQNMKTWDTEEEEHESEKINQRRIRDVSSI